MTIKKVMKIFLLQLWILLNKFDKEEIKYYNLLC